MSEPALPPSLTPDEITDLLSTIEQLERLELAMPPGRWVHDRYRNENGWWSALVQVRGELEDDGFEVAMSETVIRLLNTVVANQEKGGDILEYIVRCRRLVPLLLSYARRLLAVYKELKLVKLAFEETPKQWSTAHAPTLEALAQTFELFKLREENERLRAELAKHTTPSRNPTDGH